MDELSHLGEDETVAAVRGRGPLPLPLEGWNQVSTWGWDETTGSLHAYLRRNVGGQAQLIQIGPDDYTPPITRAAILAQHIAMATDCDPWTALTALHDAAGLNDEDDPPARTESGAVVTMAESYSLPEWPFRQQRW